MPNMHIMLLWTNMPFSLANLLLASGPCLLAPQLPRPSECRVINPRTRQTRSFGVAGWFMFMNASAHHCRPALNSTRRDPDIVFAIATPSVPLQLPLLQPQSFEPSSSYTVRGVEPHSDGTRHPNRGVSTPTCPYHCSNSNLELELFCGEKFYSEPFC